MENHFCFKERISLTSMKPFGKWKFHAVLSTSFSVVATGFLEAGHDVTGRQRPVNTVDVSSTPRTNAKSRLVSSVPLIPN